MSHKHLFHIHNKQDSYVLLEIFMQFVTVKAKIWLNNEGCSFLWNTVY